MNAQVTWDRLLTAFANGDWDDIEVSAGARLFWLNCGGGPPRIIPRDDFEDWNRALAEAGCRHALSTLGGRWSLTRTPVPPTEPEHCHDC